MIVELTSTDATNFCESFPNDEFYLSTEAVHLAITEQRQFNIIHPTTGLKIDVFVLNDSAFEQSRFRRRKKHELEKALLAWFATPEDVILKKLVYYNEGESEKHIRDIIGVLKIQGKLIDYAYLSQWANQLNLSELWQDVLAQSETDQRKTDDAS
ncbi:hypothetical protein [uncultured Rubinisphaera sp.]|uniref:hypothetical protein n=1 Tax=uncultured Rubinisphaera sp. TaxID=1678686 RepID=UPI0030DDC203